MCLALDLEMVIFIVLTFAMFAMAASVITLALDHP